MSITFYLISENTSKIEEPLPRKKRVSFKDLPNKSNIEEFEDMLHMKVSIFEVVEPH